MCKKNCAVWDELYVELIDELIDKVGTFRANLHENGTTTDPEGRWRSSNFLE